MKFISTRGGEKITGARAIVKGLPDNGGLFVPEKFPVVSREELVAMLEAGYAERAAVIIEKFFDEFDGNELLSVCEEACSRFDGNDPAPLVKIDDGVFMLELWHGPTCAYEDISLTVLPYLLKKSCSLCGVKEELLIPVATSGDAGKAALESFSGADGVRIAVFYPADGVSKIQKLQLSTQEGGNVNVVAVKGSFDVCQTAVKEMFANRTFAEELKNENAVLASANSVNVGRIIPQTAYYFSAYADLVSSGQIAMGEEIDFAVPAGNFGNVLSAYYAKRMGLPVRRLHCASNENKVIADFLTTGVYDTRRQLHQTTSPSMDILIPSNLERLLFEASGRNAKLTAQRMAQLKDEGRCEITSGELALIRETFDGGFADEETSVEAMYGVFEEVGYTMDTNTGCAMKVAQDWFAKNKKDETKTVIVSTVNPYKFPQDVLYAVTGNDVKDSFKGIKRLHAATAMSVPKCLSALRDKPVRFTKTVEIKKIPEEMSVFLKKRVDFINDM